MTGPKLNEGATDRSTSAPGSTQASARYLRGSATKAREVLDLIRGLDVRRADEVLQFTDRDAAEDVRKVLASAVANAVHNDNQDADELYVVACFADEGPTLKRFRPRARGRASRIRKRTCHITVIVARMSDERLEVVQARQAASGRRRRPRRHAARAGVTASRAAGHAPRACGLVPTRRDDADDADASDAAEDDDVDEADEVEAADVSPTPPRSSRTPSRRESRRQPRRRPKRRRGPSGSDLPAGAVAAPEDGSVPDGYPIKGNTNSMKYHEPGGRYYDVDRSPRLYFDTARRAPRPPATRLAEPPWTRRRPSDDRGRGELMGQKINPYGFRLGVTTDWKSRWFSERQYKDYLTEDWKIRKAIMRRWSRRRSAASRSSARGTRSASTCTPPVRAS